jgi:3-oxoacyl-[acyl-carrier-protein] synthase II
MSSRRVLVTGVGLVSPLALSVEPHFQGWIGGKSAVHLTSNPVFAENGPYLEARVTDFDRKEVLTNRMLRKLLSTSAGYAVSAAREAVSASGLGNNPSELERCGLWVGSLSLEIDPEQFVPPLRASLNNQGEFEISQFARRGMKLLDPLFLVRALPNAGTCGISIELQILGPNTNLTNGTTSGIMAVCLAAAAIQRGEIDCALAGGYDTLLGMDSIAEHMVSNRLSNQSSVPEKACKPFDKSRDGYVLGEGAAFVFLESEEHALKRGAQPYAELASFGTTMDSSLLFSKNPQDGTALYHAACEALQSGGCDSANLGLIVGDGLGTELDDLRESGVYRQITNGDQTAFTASTSSIGFTGAASGVFSLIHAALALQHQVLPPLLNCDDPDPLCAMNFVTQATQSEFRHALAWNSDRGVKNVAILLSAYL